MLLDNTKTCDLNHFISSGNCAEFKKKKVLKKLILEKVLTNLNWKPFVIYLTKYKKKKKKLDNQGEGA